VTDPPRTAEPLAVTGELTSRGRRTRGLIAAAAILLLLYGTFFGSDHDFPFGPLHMYSHFYPATGVVTSTSVQATNANGHIFFVTQGDIGIARGDIEGELPAYEANPSRLGSLASAFHDRHPLASPFVSMRIVQKQWHLKDRAVVGVSTVTLVTWSAGS
jgi:hypothetical protein